MPRSTDNPKDAAPAALAENLSAGQEAEGRQTITPAVKPIPKRAAVHALGCRLNLAEAGLLRDQLQSQGYQLVPWGETADVYVLNSCTVTAQADAKTRQSLRAARRRNPSAQVAVTGCHAQLHAQSLATEGLADLIVGTAEKMALPGYLIQENLPSAPLPSTNPQDTGASALAPARIVLGQPRREAFQHGPLEPMPFRIGGGSTRAHLKIQEGCDFMCAFCVIPAARGRARSRDFADLLSEARGLLAAGRREIVITGVNLGSYAQEENSLLEVVDALSALPGLARLRMGSIEPTTFGLALLERMADPTHPLQPFLHLPLQSGSGAVLERMKRLYTPEEYRRFCLRALELVPDLHLGTDVLVGFPGEDEAAFAETLALLESLPFASLHVFPYSERPQTAAARWEGTTSLAGAEHVPNTVPKDTRKARAAVVRALGEAKALAFHQRFLGQALEVLFEAPTRAGLAQGHTANYIHVEASAPEGVDAASLQNTLGKVRLLEAGRESVAGEIVAGGE